MVAAEAEDPKEHSFQEQGQDWAYARPTARLHFDDL